MTTEEAAAKVAEFVKLAEKATPGPWYFTSDGGMIVGNIPPGTLLLKAVLPGMQGHHDLRLALEARQIPEAVVALVREARGWLVAQDYVDDMNGTPDEDLKKFLAATAPIVGEQKESGHAE